MFKSTKMIWLLMFMPLLTNAAYDIKFDYTKSVDYTKDKRGDCNGEHFLLANQGNLDQNACETACDERPLCTGYSFKSGSCMLKKNISLCAAEDWKTTTGYEYYSKPLELDLYISDKISSLKATMLTDENKNTIKYCLQVPANAKEGDKLETTLCSVAQGHKGQTFTLAEVTPATNPKTYKIIHLNSNLCVDLLEFLVDDNPTRLWNCNLTQEPIARQQRQHFRFQTTEIPKGMENYTPFKVRLNTAHDLSLIPDYFMRAIGDCPGNDLPTDSFLKGNTEDCANACNKKNDCKGFSYNYGANQCYMKTITNCTTRDLTNGYIFYSRKSAL